MDRQVIETFVEQAIVEAMAMLWVPEGTGATDEAQANFKAIDRLNEAHKCLDLIMQASWENQDDCEFIYEKIQDLAGKKRACLAYVERILKADAKKTAETTTGYRLLKQDEHSGYIMWLVTHSRGQELSDKYCVMQNKSNGEFTHAGVFRENGEEMPADWVGDIIQ